MRLTDVARASLAELANDFINWIMIHKSAPWSTRSEFHKEVWNTTLDHPAYKDDVQHQSCIHILNQKQKFDKWLNSDDSLVVANCILILCNRLILILRKQIEGQLATFKDEGGFTEGLTAERLAAKANKSRSDGAPLCPVCGNTMIRRMARKGINSGKEFWSCSNYPECNGLRNI